MKTVLALVTVVCLTVGTASATPTVKRFFVLGGKDTVHTKAISEVLLPGDSILLQAVCKKDMKALSYAPSYLVYDGTNKRGLAWRLFKLAKTDSGGDIVVVEGTNRNSTGIGARFQLTLFCGYPLTPSEYNKYR